MIGRAWRLLACAWWVALSFGTASAAAPRALRIAVLPFASASEDPGLATLGSGLQAMLTTDLAVSPLIALVERERLEAIEGEIARSRGGAFDPATAVRVGKLLGASHLLPGPITVVGATMRIDARLVDAASGEVVLADKIEGERDLFFEHEKALAQRLVAALGTPLTPKERARLQRIHTADFDAFRRFSDGIAAFDHRAFDDARRALREALDKDQEFQLARLTLDDYEGIIAKLDARRELLEAGERARVVEARTARGAEQKLILERTFALAQSRDPIERALALYALGRWHDPRDKQDLELHLGGDAFLLERQRDAFRAAYQVEAEALFPKIPYFGTRDYIGRPPREAADLDKEQAQWVARFLRNRAPSEAQRFNALLDDIEAGIAQRDPARVLRLDTVGEARLCEKAYQRGVALDPDAIDLFFGRAPHWRSSVASTLGDRFRAAGLFDESTRWYAESGRLASEPSRARWAAAEVERNRDTVAFLAAHPSPRVREWMMLNGWRAPTERHQLAAVAALEAEPLGVPGRVALAYARQLRAWRDEPYMLLGGRALYPMEGAFFATGARTDRFAARDLDAYRKASKNAEVEWWRAFFEGQHEGALTARFEVRYAPDPEWWSTELLSQEPTLGAAGFVDARPELLFLFGAKDLDVPLVADPDERGRQRQQRGLAAWGVRVGRDGVAIVKVTEPEIREGFSVARGRLAFEVLDEDDGAVEDGAKVLVTVRGREVTARVGRRSLGATLPIVPSGFTGFAVLGAGHVRVVAPTVEIKR